MPSSKHLQRAGTHLVLGHGPLSVVRRSVPRARVLEDRRAGADANRWAALL